MNNWWWRMIQWLEILLADWSNSLSYYQYHRKTSNRSKDEVYLIYNKTGKRYYVYDGETYEFDVKGKHNIPQAVNKFYDLVDKGEA